MNEIIQIKCPFCGAVLSVKNIPDIDKKNVTCPICKQTNRFVNYKLITPNAIGGTKPSGNEVYNSQRSYESSSNEETQYGPMNFTIGRLKLHGSNISYQLKPGKNEVGRKSKNSLVDFQIDTGESRRMSRNHLVIEVVKENHKGYVHYVSLSKENVNPTTVNGNPMCYGVDKVILNNGAIIKLPDAELRFIIPDEEATELN